MVDRRRPASRSRPRSSGSRGSSRARRPRTARSRDCAWLAGAAAPAGHAEHRAFSQAALEAAATRLTPRRAVAGTEAGASAGKSWRAESQTTLCPLNPTGDSSSVQDPPSSPPPAACSPPPRSRDQAPPASAAPGHASATPARSSHRCTPSARSARRCRPTATSTPTGSPSCRRASARCTAGDFLVSNFNAKSNNQGTGTTIVS